MLSTLVIVGRVFVFDYGKSFEKLCHEHDGNYIEVNPSHPISIKQYFGEPTGDD